MNGAESLVETLAGAGVDVCFANPGTSEMHFVAALDRVGGMRCVLGLFEGVATGAADGYARMAGQAGLHPSAPGPRARQRPRQRAQRPARQHADGQHRRRPRDLPQGVRRAAHLRHRGCGAALLGLGADLGRLSLGRARRSDRRGRGDGPAGAGRDLDPPRRRLLERGRRAGPAAPRRGPRAGRTRGHLRRCQGLALRRARRSCLWAAMPCASRA